METNPWNKKKKNHWTRNNSPASQGSRRNVWNWKGKPWYKFHSPVVELRSVIRWGHGNESWGVTAEDGEEYLLCIFFNALCIRLKWMFKYSSRSRKGVFLQTVRTCMVSLCPARSLSEHQSLFLCLLHEIGQVFLSRSVYWYRICASASSPSTRAPSNKRRALCSLLLCCGARTQGW